MDSGKITTAGGNGYGLWAEIGNGDSTATATASVTGGGTVKTIGSFDWGVYARNVGNGSATVELVDSTVETVTPGGRLSSSWPFRSGYTQHLCRDLDLPRRAHLYVVSFWGAERDVSASGGWFSGVSLMFLSLPQICPIMQTYWT